MPLQRDNPFVSITIQTYNRAAVLAETLETLRSLRRPAAMEYEILVVDNNSHDETADVIGRYRDLLAPRLRGVFEPRQGLSHARNRALAEARGTVVSFLDDDVVVEPGWLEAVWAAFTTYGATVVGGRSYLIYPPARSRPAWLPAHHEDMYSRLDYGPEPLVGTDKELFGLNFSVLREEALAVGGFDSSFGRCGNKLACGEESDLLARLRRTGGVVVYEPRAVVGHKVPAERLTKKWLLRRVYHGALSSGRSASAGGARPERVSGLLLHVLRCWGSVGRGVVSRGLSPEDFFERQYHAALSLGRLMAALEALRSRRRLRADAA
ncbi:MAG: glycosyltransferase [Planctomycetes bacterium]|jgi:glycosyltransferase involved in cell wall biosynthesis|nr:glycosyltransferase [Planctomycetota bacterium]